MVAATQLTYLRQKKRIVTSIDCNTVVPPSFVLGLETYSLHHSHVDLETADNELIVEKQKS
jgi:hypothetical protein